VQHGGCVSRRPLKQWCMYIYIGYVQYDSVYESICCIIVYKHKCTKHYRIITPTSLIYTDIYTCSYMSLSPIYHHIGLLLTNKQSYHLQLQRRYSSIPHLLQTLTCSMPSPSPHASATALHTDLSMARRPPLRRLSPQGPQHRARRGPHCLVQRPGAANQHPASRPAKPAYSIMREPVFVCRGLVLEIKPRRGRRHVGTVTCEVLLHFHYRINP
jgi:hypothetical protein